MGQREECSMVWRLDDVILKMEGDSMADTHGQFTVQDCVTQIKGEKNSALEKQDSYVVETGNSTIEIEHEAIGKKPMLRASLEEELLGCNCSQ